MTFAVGRLFLPRLLRTKLGRRLIPDKQRVWGEGLVARHGFRAILLGRFLVALRGPVYLAIGASKYPTGRFLAINTATALVEVALVMGFGVLYGSSRAAAGKMKGIDLAVALVIALVLILPPLLKALAARRTAREAS